MSWLLAGALVPSFLTSLAAGFAVRRWAPRLGLVDRPGARKVHQHPTPLGGGLAIWLGMILPLAAGQAVVGSVAAARAETSSAPWLAQLALPEIVETHLAGLGAVAGRLWSLLGAGTLLVLLGLADDRGGLDWRLRLGVQVLVAGAMVAGGWRLTIFLDLPWLTVPLSILWIVALINSFNMLDNMDGLAGGVAAIAAAILAAVMLLAPNPAANGPQLFIGGFLLVLVGALAGFLWHNRPPARLFMGDAGAYFVGFLLAAATMMATFSGGGLPRHSILAPLCVLAVPLYDLTSVVAIRLREGRSPFVGDKSHFSHRLVDLGLSKVQAVLTIYLATATTGLGALLLYQVSALGAAVVIANVACVLGLIAILETTARRNRSR